MIRTGDMYKNIESGKMFTVKSANSKLIILATKDESHSMFVNPNNIESTFVPFVEDEHGNVVLKTAYPSRKLHRRYGGKSSGKKP
jgi:hypothetical protein